MLAIQVCYLAVVFDVFRFIDWWVGKYREGYDGSYYDKLLKRASTANSKVNPALKQVRKQRAET